MCYMEMLCSLSVRLYGSPWFLARGSVTSGTSKPTNLLTLFQNPAASQQDIIMQDLHQGLILTGVYLKTISLPA